MRYPLHHAIDLAIARSPIHGIEARRIHCIVEVDLHRRKALRLDPRKLSVRLFPNGNIHIRVAIDADFIAELAAHKLVHGQLQRLAGKVPQRNFQARQGCDVLSTLRASEDSQGANPLPYRFDIERISPDERAPPTMDQRRGSDSGVRGFSLPVDALIRVNPDVRLRSMNDDLRGAHLGDLELRPLKR